MTQALDLNERQFDALLFFYQQREIVTSVYIKKYKVVDRTARRDLVELVEKGLLIREGVGKGSKYKYR
jgi:ATP-dependent DNA helicase RecG